MLICSTRFENREAEIARKLAALGHEVVFTAGHDETRSKGEDWHKFGARMMRKSIKIIKDVDAVLCLNFDKAGMKNYIGGATFCEICYAFEHGKEIFILNDLPENSERGPRIRFELEMFEPVVLRGDLRGIK
jgi:hypothetical protein